MNPLLRELAEMAAAQYVARPDELSASETTMYLCLTVLLVASVWKVLAGAGRPG